MEEYIKKDEALSEFKRIYFDNATVIRCSELVLNSLPTYSMPDIEKIRTEIAEHRRKTEAIDTYDLLGDALDIIDKHIKGE